MRWRSRTLPTSVLDPERPSAPTTGFRSRPTHRRKPDRCRRVWIDGRQLWWPSNRGASRPLLRSSLTTFKRRFAPQPAFSDVSGVPVSLGRQRRRSTTADRRVLFSRAGGRRPDPTERLVALPPGTRRVERPCVRSDGCREPLAQHCSRRRPCLRVLRQALHNQGVERRRNGERGTDAWRSWRLLHVREGGCDGCAPSAIVSGGSETER